MALKNKKSFDVELSPNLERAAFTSIIAIGAASLGASYYTDLGIHLWDHVTANYGTMAFVLDLAYFAASWQRVRTERVGGKTILERPVKEVGAGWHFVPFGIGKLLSVPVAVQEVQFPGDPEQISKRLDSKGLFPGEFRPMRIMTGLPSESGVKDDILNERTAVEVTFSVRWQVCIDNFFEFWINTPGRTWEAKKKSIEKQMRDTGENELTEQIAQISAGDVSSNISVLNEKLFAALEKAVRGWGITIKECRMQSPDYGEGITHALARIPIANADAKTTRINAATEKGRLVTLSEGQAQARANLLEADGLGYAKAAEAAGMETREYRNGVLATEILGKKTILIGEAGITGAMGVVKTAVGALK